jgi:CBS domain containing-hemolysin-like protein
MPEPSAASGTKEADSRRAGSGPLWRGLRALLFGEEPEPSLRRDLEDALAEYDSASDEGAATAKGVAVPRGDIIAISQEASFAELIALIAEAGHSRIPVFDGTLDHITGMIHIRDAFAILARGEAHPDSLAGLIREPLYVPQSQGVLDLLADMRARRTHLAIVLDEYSGTDGLVTIEDLVEEIVGNIEDEHDDEPEPMLIALEGGQWEADARTELDEVAKLIDPRLAEVEQDVDTLGGLASVIAGRVPEAGEILLHTESGWRIEVIEADAKRVGRVRLHPPATVMSEG